MTVSSEECAHELLEIAPLIMRVIRSEMRSHRTPDLTVPQFRALAYLHRLPGSSLSAVAEHVGLALPSMSTMIEGLVTRKLVTRQTSPADRRCVTLTLTRRGQTMLEAARQEAQARLTEMVAALSAEERAGVVEALRTLRPIFSSEDIEARPAKEVTE
jgi:DNA-binding MarR family transcriptional regulator